LLGGTKSPEGFRLLGGEGPEKEPCSLARIPKCLATMELVNPLDLVCVGTSSIAALDGFAVRLNSDGLRCGLLLLLGLALLFVRTGDVRCPYECDKERPRLAATAESKGAYRNLT
jgi:hypothetical protein